MDQTKNNIYFVYALCHVSWLQQAWKIAYQWLRTTGKTRTVLHGGVTGKDNRCLTIDGVTSDVIGIPTAYCLVEGKVTPLKIIRMEINNTLIKFNKTQAFWGKFSEVIKVLKCHVFVLCRFQNLVVTLIANVKDCVFLVSNVTLNSNIEPYILKLLIFC